MKSLPLIIRWWIIAFLLTGGATVWAFHHLDVPIAYAVYPYAGHLTPLGEGLGSAILIAGEAVVLLSLVTIRILHGHMSPLANALAVACLTSIAAYAINTAVLKFLFGVPVPYAVIEQGITHGLNVMENRGFASFPSGHMVLSGAFAGVFMRLYRRAILPLAALQALGAALLIAGDFHFLSDTLAGTFVGLTAGLMAGELLKAREQSHG